MLKVRTAPMAALLTAGIRADDSLTMTAIWSSGSFNGVLPEQHPPRATASSTARAGARKDFGDDLYLRSTAYAGLHVPTLDDSTAIPARERRDGGRTRR